MRFRVFTFALIVLLWLIPGGSAQADDVSREGPRSGLRPGEMLWRGETLVSPDGSTRLAFRPDGNLVLYEHATPVWSSGTAGQGGLILIMHGNGDLVMYGKPSLRRVLWRSDTAGYDGAELRLPEDGGATIRLHDGQLLWSAGLPVPEVGLEGEKHIIFDRRGERMEVWLVEADGHITDFYPVSGADNNPSAGRYQVYSKSEVAYGFSGGQMKHMVRFAYGNNQGLRIGFHSIPTGWRGPVQTEEQLGQALSAGCVRQRDDKAEFLFYWAPVGTPVVVLG